MLNYEKLVRLLDAQIDALLPRQVMQKDRPDYGGFISEGLAGATNVSSVSSLGYAYLLDGSRFYQREEILERIQAGAAFGRQVRRPSGCYDLVTTNFDSSPDTGFMVKSIGPVVRAARKASEAGDSGAGEIAEVLGELIQTAAPGMVKGGFHTPNHRWVLVAALAQVHDLFPDLDVMPTIEAYLGETIDINEDGEYTERSTGTYNAICNRALRMAAEALDRPGLLVPVRQNLDLSYHLLHADGSVVTSISKRQDRGQKVVLVNMVDSYYDLARRDGNGFYAAVADWLFDQQPGGLPWTVHPFLEHPEWREDTLEREPLPESYSKVYPVAGLWRVRRGKMSATTAAGITAPFSLKYGNLELTSVNVCASYFAVSQFVGENFREEAGKVVMTHPGRGSYHDSPVYYMPLDEPVPTERFYEMRKERDVYAVPPLVIDLEMEEVEQGFDVVVRTREGLDRVPFQIACDFVPGGELDFDSGVIQGQAGDVVFLKSGYATYHIGNDAISIGPGAYTHRMWNMRGSESAPNAFRVLITLMTPVDQVLKVRCGTWSSAEEEIVGQRG
ncbi:MAG: hypothetical protein O7G87_07570 [bacterium]|nr:hypothetical protein [bacterium]